MTLAVAHALSSSTLPSMTGTVWAAAASAATEPAGGASADGRGTPIRGIGQTVRGRRHSTQTQYAAITHGVRVRIHVRFDVRARAGGYSRPKSGLHRGPLRTRRRRPSSLVAPDQSSSDAGCRHAGFGESARRTAMRPFGAAPYGRWIGSFATTPRGSHAPMPSRGSSPLAMVASMVLTAGNPDASRRRHHELAEESPSPHASEVSTDSRCGHCIRDVVRSHGPSSSREPSSQDEHGSAHLRAVQPCRDRQMPIGPPGRHHCDLDVVDMFKKLVHFGHGTLRLSTFYCADDPTSNICRVPSFASAGNANRSPSRFQRGAGSMRRSPPA